MPVTTRRQSKGPHHSNATERWREDRAARTTLGSEDDDDPMYGSISDLSSSEDEEHEPVRDEHESGTSEAESNHEESDDPESDDDYRATRPMAKRRKLENAGRASSSKSAAKAKRTGISRRVQGRLQNMLSLSYDVLFLIFSELGPMDLVNLARTSKSLRNVLMSRKSIWVWIAARRNGGVTRVPDPPEDMSEPAWALLLFGPAVCSQCSTKNVHRVDFALRRRLCTACRKRNLVFSIKFRTQCPGLKESVMDLLPYTKLGGWAHGHVAGSRFYWKPDLYEMGKRLAELEEDRRAGKPGAQQRLKSFRAERILFVDSIVQSSAEFEEWAQEEAEAQVRIGHERRTQRHEALKERILAAGYVSADIDFIGINAVPGANVDRALTEEAWRRIRPKVEMKLSSARKHRLLQRELDYKTEAEQCYSDLLRQILPMQRSYLPAVPQACELSCFKDLLNSDRDVQLAEWEHAKGQLPESLSEWMTERRDRYTSQLPSQVYDAQEKAMEVKLLSDPSIDHWRQEEMRNFAGQLELATSVFRHPVMMNTVLIGRDACHAWKMKGELEFVERGAVATHAILEELQLDPSMTTASMLDQLNKHFICASCPVGLDRYRHSWRSYVAHFAYSKFGHPHPEWREVSPDETGSEDEDDLGPFWTPPESWTCNHCSGYFVPGSSYSNSGWFLTKGKAILHVQTEHHIDNPIIDVDFFPNPIFV